MVIAMDFKKRARFFQNSDFTNFGDCAEKGKANKKHVVQTLRRPTSQERFLLKPEYAFDGNVSIKIITIK